MNDKTKAASNIKAAQDQSRKQTAAAVEQAGIKAPTGAALASAQQEGVTEAIKENAKEAYRYMTDGQLPGEPPARQFTNSDAHTNLISGMLSLSPDELAEAIADDAASPMTEDQVANLLALERAGPNRTDHVQLLCKRLGVKSPYEVTNAGPAYTNDISATTAVTR